MSTIGREMKCYLPPATSVTETYLIITHFLLDHMFSNYDIQDNHTFFFTSSTIMFPLTAFFKEIIVKTKQQFYILNISLGQTKYIMAE